MAFPRFRTGFAVVLVGTALFLAACSHQEPGTTIETTNQTRATAEDAYIFGYPLVLMDATRAKLSNVPRSTDMGAAPINQFANMKAFPDASFTEVVSPNADTLYSQAWLDLEKEPVVLSVPDTHGRYYLMPMLDGWTNVFASPGKRTTGTGKGEFAITGPHWSGVLPAGLKEIKAPTDMVWIIGRTQANGKSDFAAVNAIQSQYKLTPLSAWGKSYTPPRDVAIDPNVDVKLPPVEAIASMNTTTFFNKLAMLMKDNPPAAADAPMVAKLASIGVVSGQSFDLDRNGSDIAKQINDGVQDAKNKLPDLGHKPGNAKTVNGWTLILQDIGTYGTDYAARAGIAWVGLGANVPSDAIYPLARVDEAGNPLNGSNKYVIHFDKGQTPPANAFWSITMYNAKQAFVANPINRYAIGDRDKLKFNEDGSLDIYVEHDSPGKEKESNWLPADAESFNVALRIYWPKGSV